MHCCMDSTWYEIVSFLSSFILYLSFMLPLGCLISSTNFVPFSEMIIFCEQQKVSLSEPSQEAIPWKCMWPQSFSLSLLRNEFSGHLCQLTSGIIHPQSRITVIDISHHLHNHFYFSVTYYNVIYFITIPLGAPLPLFYRVKKLTLRNNVPHPTSKWLSHDLNSGCVTDSKTHINPVSMMFCSHLFYTHQH